MPYTYAVLICLGLCAETARRPCEIGGIEVTLTGKRIAAFLLALLMTLLCSCSRQEALPPESDDSDADGSFAAILAERNGYVLHAAVLYDGSGNPYGWSTTLDYLRQSLALNLEVQGVDVRNGWKLRGYDILYLDESLLSSAAAKTLPDEILHFTRSGGAVFAPNGFHSYFPAEFFGASEFLPVEGYPAEISAPEVDVDLREMQELIVDFHSVYPDFADFEDLSARSYGYAMKPNGAQALVTLPDGSALYAVNEYGEGCVFFVNPLLPNEYCRGSFSLSVRDEEQASFANTAASCSQLLLGDFASLAAKRLYGFSLERVFGAYGAPDMSWEIHYEDITAMEHDSLSAFSAICESERQVLSFTLVRNPYAWFEQAETMAYAMNEGGPGALSFSLDRNESVYSSGTHIASGGRWLQLNALQDCDSYFADAPQENYRLYPCVLDYDGDGLPDVFCGSSDGKVYYCRGRGFSGVDARLVMDEPVEVANVGMASFSAPQLADLNGDGVLDLILGGANGALDWYRGTGSLRFEAMGELIRTDIPGQCLPVVGDINGDGALDLAVGSDQGILIFFYGEELGGYTTFSHRNMSALSKQCADAGFGKWLAPSLCDYDGDGVCDLALGTFDGYVALHRGDGRGGFAFERFVTAEDMNYKGNHNLKFGTYCTPVLCDLDADGALDLLCGYEEYGMAYPIDSPYFPFRRELQSQIDFAKSKDYYIGVHYLCGTYYSADRERFELSAQLDALASYGLTDLKGVNQHTWHLSSFDESQSLRAIWDAGLLWESGYAPSGATNQAPQVAAENVIALPFYVMDGGERTLLIQNCSTLLYRDGAWTDLSGKYRMPVFAYYHCDMIYKSDEGAKEAASTVSAFRDKFGYNFVREDQMMYAIAAAYNLGVEVQSSGDGFMIEPYALRTDFPQYNENAQRACGVRLDFASGVEETMGTDAAVWQRDGRSLLLGLDRSVNVFPETEGRDDRHLARVNTPAVIDDAEGGANVRFLERGLMEVTVSGRATTSDPGWTVTERPFVLGEQKEETVFSKFGGEETVHIVYAD